MTTKIEHSATQLAAAVNVKNIWGGIFINAKASPFNAKGDGVADDTVALQTAVDYAISIGKKDIHLPAGTYIYTTLTNTADISFYGDGVTLSGTTVLDLLSFNELSDRISNIVASAGTSNTEIVDARLPDGGSAYATLKARLDTESAEVAVSITAEETARVAGDVALDVLITAEETARTAGDTTLDNRINNIIASSGTSDTEVVDARQPESGTAYPTLKGRLDAHEADFTSKFNSTTANESAALGTELADATGWTSVNWTGDFATGFTHTTGNTTPLSRTMPATGTKMYMIEVTVSSPTSSSAFTIKIGNSVPFVMYEGAGILHTYSRGITSISDGDFVLTPESAFDGTVTVSIKEITAQTSPTMTIKDSTDANVLEIRPTTQALANVFIGEEVGRFNVTGHENVAIGTKAMRVSSSGFWNVAVGYNALRDNQSGSRNVALGYIALSQNISGHRNIALGSFSLTRNTHGINNIALGADSLFANTTGNYNIALGLAALAESVTGDGNVAIGTAALATINGSNYNIAIGDYALAFMAASAYSSVAIGHDALRNATVSPNTAIGDEAALSTTTGADNVAIGWNALRNNVTGDRNIAIGNSAGSGAVGGSLIRNIIIGGNSGTAMTTGANYNTIIGHSAAGTMTTGNNNILLGYNTQIPAATNTFYLNIGNTIYGWMGANQKQIGINVTNPSARMHLPASTIAAGSAPLKLNPGVLMTTPESGAWEFDGTNLYFTVGSTRKLVNLT